MKRKLTPEQETEVRRLYFTEKLPTEAIAERFQISKSLISRLTGGMGRGSNRTYRLLTAFEG